jgi:hypothetical protein
VIEEDEASYLERQPFYIGHSHLISTLAAINDESLIKLSPVRENKR